MSASLEIRVPYVDHKLVEFVNALPIRFKVDWHLGIQKYILKRVALDTYGEHLVDSVLRRKVGLGGEDSPPEELIADFEENGLEASRLRREGRLLMRAEEDPLGDRRGDALARILEEEAGKGRTVWASFDWVKRVDLRAALGQQERLAGIVDASRLVLKTAALEAAIDGWTPSELRRVQSAHAAIILASEGGLSLSRATPMPPS